MRGCVEEGVAQDFGISEGDAERRIKDSRFVPAVTVQRVTNVVFQFCSEVRISTVWKFRG